MQKTSVKTIIIFVMLILVLFELFARSTFHPGGKALPEKTLIYDEKNGWILHHNFNTLYEETLIPIEINSKGLRDYEHSYKRNDSKHRIVFIGDTLVFGVGALVEDSIPKRVEQMLKKDGNDAEVINGGIPGYQIINEKNFYFTELRKYDVDRAIIVIALNDILPVNMTEVKATFDRGGDPGDPHPDTPVVSAIKKVCYSCVLSYSVALRIKNHKRIGDEGYVRDIYDGWSNPESLEFYFEHLSDIVTDLKERNISVLLVVPPYEWQLEDFDERSNPQKVLKSFANERGIEILDLNEEFIRVETSSYYNTASGGTVMNSKGFELIASTIYKHLKEGPYNQ